MFYLSDLNADFQYFPWEHKKRTLFYFKHSDFDYLDNDSFGKNKNKKIESSNNTSSVA